ncbi:methyltransferase domain-containing protein [Colletotrichum navitas]|uniref:Methyltransferase domain-containing protein n=1 Tax=Colletotrichum navitas TaxID=681940 RepID=A0AAD8V6T5_9PEZI|nr:methyltransferase domain-containing protein [Colletotrichum navitas]KAK1594633.1 methyltransferase domain-containing protein [Colletotrichum navitas]
MAGPANNPPVAAAPPQLETVSPVDERSPETELEPAVIEVEDTDDLNESASNIDDRISTYTASVSSSVIDHPTENGRRYHAFRAGEATEVGELLPNSEVIGNDLSANQPTCPTPPNVKFEIDDVESPWVNAYKFDFIFCRHMVGAIADWPKLMSNIYEELRSTNPGGWVEFQDYDLLYTSEDGSLTEEHQTLKWIRLILEACDKMGRDGQAGFVNIAHEKFIVSIGPWPKDTHHKDVGMCNLIQMLDGLEAFSLRVFCGVLGWTRAEVLVLLAMVRKDLKSCKFHAKYYFHVVYAQKPGATDRK